MQDNTPHKNHFYFFTRDLLTMAVLSSLGGITSTYVNAISDVVHAMLGFPGASQWAAGLHVVWIVLAMGITGKPGTGILTGLLKGGVELMSGNSHGVIILLVDLVAGLLVDFAFLLFKSKRALLPYLLAGGLATASNVIVFQFFATLPKNILALGAILILVLVAFLSGLIFAGFIPYILINSLTKAGIVKVSHQPEGAKKIGWYALISVLILAILMAVFLKLNEQGPQEVAISGSVSAPYFFPYDGAQIDLETREMDYHGVMTEYSGYPLKDIVEQAKPTSDANTLLLEASDGYAFMISFEEMKSNPNILVVRQGQGNDVSFDIVGPESSKAWVRNITKITVIDSVGLRIIDTNGDEGEFDPDKWLSEMDSTQVNLPEGSKKLQGVPVWKVIEANLQGKSVTEILFNADETTQTIPWSEISGNDSLRLFTVISENGITFALAEMSGQVHLYPLTEIEIK
ncbi:MAG: ECF transporter S component [Anaerolineales bacterium]